MNPIDYLRLNLFLREQVGWSRKGTPIIMTHDVSMYPNWNDVMVLYQSNNGDIILAHYGYRPSESMTDATLKDGDFTVGVNPDVLTFPNYEDELHGDTELTALARGYAAFIERMLEYASSLVETDRACSRA